MVTKLHTMQLTQEEEARLTAGRRPGRICLGVPEGKRVTENPAMLLQN